MKRKERGGRRVEETGSEKHLPVPKENPASVRDIWCASLCTVWARDVHSMKNVGDNKKRLHEDYDQIAQRSLRLPWRGPLAF